MPQNDFFRGWNSGSSSLLELETGSGFKEVSQNEEELSDVPEYLYEFQIHPEEFFDTYGEEAPLLVENLLTEKIDENIFTKTYSNLLRFFCLSCDKELPWEALMRVVSDSNGQSKEKVRKFLKRSGLAQDTYKRLEMLKMEKELETFRGILDS